MRPADILWPTLREKIDAQVCFSCGKAADTFRDEISEREQKISGLCQTCQDKVFTEEEA